MQAETRYVPGRPGRSPAADEASSRHGGLALVPTGDLHRRYATDPEPAVLDALVERYQGLVMVLASRFSRSGSDVDDLNQVAYLALVKALRRFDPDRGFAFTTYAWATIGGEIKRWYRDRTWAARIPRSLQERYLAIARAVDDLNQEVGRSPTLAEIAGRVGCDEEQVIESMEAWTSRTAESFDAPRPDGRAPLEPAWGGGLDELAERMDVRGLLAGLGDRERRIVELRFFGGLSQAAIAKEIGISQMHVSRLLAASLTKLRAAAGGRD